MGFSVASGGVNTVLQRLPRLPKQSEAVDVFRASAVLVGLAEIIGATEV